MEIPIVRDVLEESNARAEENRGAFKTHKVFALNMMSSPGSGKTEILKRSIAELKKQPARRELSQYIPEYENSLLKPQKKGAENPPTGRKPSTSASILS